MASIDVKSEGSILLKETNMRDSIRPTREILLGLVDAKDVACDFVLARSGENQCSSFLLDFRMTIKYSACLDAMVFTRSLAASMYSI